MVPLSGLTISAETTTDWEDVLTETEYEKEEEKLKEYIVDVEDGDTTIVLFDEGKGYSVEENDDDSFISDELIIQDEYGDEIGAININAIDSMDGKVEQYLDVLKLSGLDFEVLALDENSAHICAKEDNTELFVNVISENNIAFLICESKHNKIADLIEYRCNGNVIKPGDQNGNAGNATAQNNNNQADNETTKTLADGALTISIKEDKIGDAHIEKYNLEDPLYDDMGFDEFALVYVESSNTVGQISLIKSDIVPFCQNALILGKLKDLMPDASVYKIGEKNIQINEVHMDYQAHMLFYNLGEKQTLTFHTEDTSTIAELVNAVEIEYNGERINPTEGLKDYGEGDKINFHVYYENEDDDDMPEQIINSDLYAAALYVASIPYSRKGLEENLQNKGYKKEAVEMVIDLLEEEGKIDFLQNAYLSAKTWVEFKGDNEDENDLRRMLISAHGYTELEVNYAIEKIKEEGLL